MGYIMKPWQDEPLFVESPYADGRHCVVVEKPFRVPAARLIEDYLALPDLERLPFVEEVMLQRQVVAYGRAWEYVYRAESDTRLEGALAMLSMAIFFIEQVKDIIDILWRVRRNLDREAAERGF